MITDLKKKPTEAEKRAEYERLRDDLRLTYPAAAVCLGVPTFEEFNSTLMEESDA